MLAVGVLDNRIVVRRLARGQKLSLSKEVEPRDGIAGIEQAPERSHRLATGGLAELIAREATVIDKVDKYLTLTGLLLIFERNS
jgi:hypothetical protein